MSLADKLTGKAQILQVDGVELKVTKATPNLDVTYSDSTDGDDYDDTDKLVYASQLPASAEPSIDIEGWYNKTTTPTGLIEKMLTSSGSPYDMQYSIDATTNVVAGKCDIQDFKITSQLKDTVSFTCKLKGNGKWTRGGAYTAPA